jgi:SRSO17 transposase
MAGRKLKYFGKVRAGHRARHIGAWMQQARPGQAKPNSENRTKFGAMRRAAQNEGTRGVKTPLEASHSLATVRQATWRRFSLPSPDSLALLAAGGL